MNESNPRESGPAALSAESQETFIRLINAAHAGLLRYLMSLLGNRADAEDVLQRASVIMWRRFDSFQPGTDFFAWASTVAFYEARNFQRSSRRARLHFDDDLMNSLAAERARRPDDQSARFDALKECVAQLPALQRELIDAVYNREEDIAEVARSTGRALQTVYNRLSAVRRALAECVQQKLEGAQ